jgi:hypothetical protein
MKELVDIFTNAAAAYGTIDDAINRPPPAPPEFKTRPTHEAVEHLERRVERLSLLCQSMWELLRERAEFTDNQLFTKVLEVDLRDGRTDGRMNSQITDCPACGRKTNSKRSTCVICGAELKKPHPFEI